MVQTAQALAYFTSSVLFGLAWQFWGPDRAIVVAAGAALAAVAVTFVVLAPKRAAA
jgi:hypothetical protein